MSAEHEMAVAIATEIGKQVPVKQAYEDAASPAMKQVGATLEDVIKCVRLVGFPIQWMAVQHDRFRASIERSARQVPETRRILPAPQILGPILEGIRYEIHDNDITEMFETLLARSMDAERQGEAHPAFVGIIKSLSSDEAKILKYLRTSSLCGDWNPHELKTHKAKIAGYDGAPVIPPKGLIDRPEMLNFYKVHLENLGLASLTIVELDPVDTHGEWRYEIQLREFGKIFIDACSPSSQ